jgi:hypothetical protein
MSLSDFDLEQRVNEARAVYDRLRADDYQPKHCLNMAIRHAIRRENESCERIARYSEQPVHTDYDIGYRAGRNDAAAVIASFREGA